ncbi:Mitochondrial intermediate peptidase [Neurospora sp. IMI 360204]|nr:Mitochondrial intermediate peptidase [Neurospora sp. IMI 360204]
MIQPLVKASRPRLWVCSNCLLRRTPSPLLRQQRRRFTGFTAQAPKTLTGSTPVTHENGGAKHDDSLLRSIFDSPETWKQFSGDKHGRNVGLFRNAYLTSPHGFLDFAQVSLGKARALVDKVLNAQSLDEYRAVVRHLDRLSDILCRVLDMADFVRVTHPDQAIQKTASVAWDMMYEYMNQLNTMTGLYDQLVKAMDNPHVSSTWSEEERMVAEVLKLDFAKSAVHLPKDARDKFVQLSSAISQTGTNFIQHMEPKTPYSTVEKSRMMGMDPVEVKRMTSMGKVYVQTLSPQASIALRTVRDDHARYQLFMASRTASRRTVHLLEQLMLLRGESAKLSGFESYGHLVLHDRMMASTPESVRQFLQALAENTRPQAQQEVADLTAAKRALKGEDVTLEPWDKDFYAESIRQAIKSRQKREDLSSYFSLGTVMQGLSRIFTRLYGIRFVPREPMPGETWHPDVRRLDVVSDVEGHVAVLYCDLFYRPLKSPNPAHFTLRCSRELSPTELAETAHTQAENPDVLIPSFESAEFAANDGMAYSRSQDGTIKQLPTIALVCDFPQQSYNRPALLSFFQLETLFHEMGHAIHSILARTSFQNVSGTRCATDLAELPSTLMEYFAADPSVLALFARHYETDNPLPYEWVDNKIREARRFEALDTENQIVLAMLDQELHSSKASQGHIDSTEVFHSLQRQYSTAPPDPQGTAWQGFFGHLVGYGSTYYSYLFDRVLAQRVWNVVFSGGQGGAALQRENGERLKENLLKWGGSKDPWKCLAGALKDERLEGGGEKAMKLVGSWGGQRRAKSDRAV